MNEKELIESCGKDPLACPAAPAGWSYHWVRCWYLDQGVIQGENVAPRKLIKDDDNVRLAVLRGLTPVTHDIPELAFCKTPEGLYNRGGLVLFEVPTAMDEARRTEEERTQNEMIAGMAGVQGSYYMNYSAEERAAMKDKVRVERHANYQRLNGPNENKKKPLTKEQIQEKYASKVPERTLEEVEAEYLSDEFQKRVEAEDKRLDGRRVASDIINAMEKAGFGLAYLEEAWRERFGVKENDPQ